MDDRGETRVNGKMALNDYQDKALSTALGAALSKETGFTYCALKLAGEAGEVSEKVGKYIRGDGPLDLRDIAKELGDVLWYVSVFAYNAGYTLEEVAQMNVDKLSSRKERGVLKGSGDDR